MSDKDLSLCVLKQKRDVRLDRGTRNDNNRYSLGGENTQQKTYTSHEKQIEIPTIIMKQSTGGNEREDKGKEKEKKRKKRKSNREIINKRFPAERRPNPNGSNGAQEANIGSLDCVLTPAHDAWNGRRLFHALSFLFFLVALERRTGSSPI